MGHLSIYLSILSILLAGASLLIATLNAFKPKIDSEYNLCFSLIDRNANLWKKYKEMSGDGKQEDVLLDILNLTEWTCIYIQSRKHFKTAPLKHLETEILEPFIKCLNKDDEIALYFRKFIKDKKSSETAFICLIQELKVRGVRV